MGITVKFYSFSKRKNSTVIPLDSLVTPTTYDCLLKDSCSLLSPVIELNVGLTTSPTSLNYAYIADFSRYYFVNDWNYNKGIWTATLSVDTLASYKNIIGAAQLYVTRAADSTVWNEDFIDTFYPSKAGYTISTQTGTNPWSIQPNGCLVLGILGNNAAQGGLQYYALTFPQSLNFFNYLYSDTFAATVLGSGSVFSALVKINFNPMQYIVSAMYMPVPYTDLVLGTPTTSNIMIGPWDSSLPGYKVNPALTASVDSQNILQPAHPQASTRGIFLNRSSYSKYRLIYEPFGQINIDPAVMTGATHLFLDTELDIATGQADLILKCGTVSGTTRTVTNTVGIYYAQAGVPIVLAQATKNPLSVITGLASSIASAFTSSNWLSGAAAVTSGIGNAAASGFPQINKQGTTGSFLPVTVGAPQLIAEFQSLADADDSHAGRPCMSLQRISDLSGFIKCQDADIVMAGTPQEKEAIAGYLTSGFFYE